MSKSGSSISEYKTVVFNATCKAVLFCSMYTAHSLGRYRPLLQREAEYFFFSTKLDLCHVSVGTGTVHFAFSQLKIGSETTIHALKASLFSISVLYLTFLFVCLFVS